MNIQIKNGRLIDPAAGTETTQDLFLADGKIGAVGKAQAGFKPDHVIDASGLAVCPGLVDLSARLREPGFEYKATLESEMLAAVAGGVKYDLTLIGDLLDRSSIPAEDIHER